MDEVELCELINSFARQSKCWTEVAGLLRQTYNESNHSSLIPIAFAFDYYYVEESQTDEKEKNGPYAPMAEFNDGSTYPPPLTTLDDSVYQYWEQLLQGSSEPLVVTRMGDLLWVRRWGDKPYNFAVKAIDAYLEIAETQIDWHGLDITFCLTRGLELSLEINNLDKAQIFIQKIIQKSLASIAEVKPKPGVTIRLLDSLLALRRKQRPECLVNLIEQCLNRYSQDVEITDQLLVRLAKLMDDERRREVYEQLVDLWVAEAENTSGFVSVANFERALTRAIKYGFPDKIEEIRKKIQEVPEESLGFKEISVTAILPNKKIEKFIQSFVDESGWRNSLTIFGMYGPPSGKYEENLQEVEKAIEEHPLLFLVSNTIYDSNNIPLKHATSIEENKQIALVRNEVLGIEFFATLAQKIIESIFHAAGRPSIEDLTEFFTTPHIPTEIAVNIAVVFDWYLKGEYDAAAHLLVPRIEAVLRNLVQKVGIAVYREASGVKAGSVLTLAELLNCIKGRIDESWRRYYLTLLTDPMGINLRNRICHGLIDQVDSSHTALLLHVICHLRLLKIQTEHQLQE